MTLCLCGHLRNEHVDSGCTAHGGRKWCQCPGYTVMKIVTNPRTEKEWDLWAHQQKVLKGEAN